MATDNNRDSVPEEAAVQPETPAVQPTETDAPRAETSEKPQSAGRLVLRLTLSLLAITSAVALMLAGVNAVTAEPIAKYAAEKRAAAMEAVLPDGRLWQDYQSVEMQAGSSKSAATVTPMVDSASSYADQNGLPHALCVETYPSGYGGAIQLMVGVTITPDDLAEPTSYEVKVNSVRIVSHSETSGVGSKTTDPSFLDQYTGRTAGITINGGENSISAISGATISSKAVTAGVNQALDIANEYVAKVLSGEIAGVFAASEGGDGE